MAIQRTGSSGTPTIGDAMLNGIAMSTAATADAFGSWFELMSSVSMATRSLLFFCKPTNFGDVLAIDIGTGAAASEVFKFRFHNAGSVGENRVEAVGPIPFSIPAGSRLAGRVANTSGATVRSITVAASVYGG